MTTPTDCRQSTTPDTRRATRFRTTLINLPAWDVRTRRLSRALDRAAKQRDAALAAGDTDIAAVFARALVELEVLAFTRQP